MELALVGSVLLWGAIGFAALAAIPRFPKAFGVAAALAAAATVVLAFGLVSNDFSLAYVAKVSSRATPWPYRLAALWGGMEGSMLFYAAITTAVAWFGLRGRPASAVGAAVSLLTLSFTALLVNPFDRLDIPAVDGEGLLALLQHPAMIYHPPILYLGLTTSVVPFAASVSGVIRGDLGAPWLRTTRRWLLISWSFLTVGMVAGANWAYVELGWGGFWAWDPVENTALMPWLAATVFLHASRVHERDSRLLRWSVMFAALPFSLTVLGVYLTRSGSTGSIHAFAEDPVIGRILLVAAVAAVIAAFVLAWRSPKGEPWEHFGLGRDSWLGLSAALIAATLIFVTVGSAYPAYVQVFSGAEVTVGPGFFVSATYPIALAVALLAGLAFSTKWATHSVSQRDLALLALTVLSIAGGALALGPPRVVPILLLALAGGSGVLLVRSMASRKPKGRVLAGHLAHLGLAMVLIGAGGSSLGDEFSGVMTPGERIEVAGESATLVEITTGSADRFIFVRAEFEVASAIAQPEIRAYEDQSLPVAEPALVTNPFRDVVVAISSVAPDASAVNVSVFVRPMVWWVWAGASVIALAGLVALFSTGVGAAKRRRLATGELQSEGTATGTPSLQSQMTDLGDQTPERR